MDHQKFTTELENHLRRELGTTPKQATHRDWWQALSLTLRDINLDQLHNSSLSSNPAKAPRQVCYLSMEFLMGRLLGDALMNLNLYEPATSPIWSSAPFARWARRVTILAWARWMESLDRAQRPARTPRPTRARLLLRSGCTPFWRSR